MKKINLLLGTLFMAITLQAQVDFTTSAAFKVSQTEETLLNYDLAIRAIEEIYESGSYEKNLRLGWLYYSNGDMEKSIEKYTQALELENKSIEAMIGIVNPMAEMGNWDDVIKIYNNILSLDPNNSLIKSRLGYIYYDRKDYAKAEKYAEDLIQYYPFDYYIMLLYADAKRQLGKTEESRDMYYRILNYSPSSSDALQGLIELN